MNTYIFLYPETSLFEITLVSYFMNTKGNVYIVAEENEVLNTYEGIHVAVDKKVDDIDIILS